MLQSVVVYSFLMSIMLFFGINESKKSTADYTLIESNRFLSFFKFGTFFPLLLFSIVFGIRYDVGVDYLGYLDIYERNDIPVKFELFFRYITLFCKGLNFNFIVYFTLLAFIQVYFFFYAFNREKYLYPFLVFFLFTNGDWLFWMNGIRQSIAMCIWVYSIKFIESKNLKLYLFWLIIAYFFHRSAIILVIFYPLLKKDHDFLRSIPIQLALLGFTFAFRIFFYDLVSLFTPIIDFYHYILGGGDLYRGYNMERLMESFREGEGTGLAYLFRIAVNILIILYSSRLKEFYNSRRFNIIYFLYFIGIITMYLFPVGFISITRPFRYFYFMQCIVLAYFMYFLYKNRSKDNNILLPVILLSFILIFYFNLYIAGDAAHVWYKFYFQAP